MIEQILRQNGFTEKESKIYLATLEAGEATIGGIATKTRLKRSTVYSVIEELLRKGILSVQTRKGIKRISPLPPQGLIERFRHATALAESALPELLEMAYSSPLKPRMRFMEGIEGIKAVMREVSLVRQPEHGMIFTDYTYMPKEILQFIYDTTDERRAFKNFLRIIIPSNPTNLEIQSKEEKMHYAEHRIANFPTKSFPLELTLFGGTKVGFLSFEPNEIFGIIIDSKAIHQTLQNIFELVWANAQPKANT